MLFRSNIYQTIGRNLYTDNTKADDGTVFGVREYIDMMQGTRDAKTYYSNLLIYMSSDEVVMFRDLKPALAHLVYKYCHSKLSEVPKQSAECLRSLSGLNHFRDLFINPEELEPCLDALRKHRHQIIDENGKFLLGEKKKSVLTAWVDCLLNNYLKEGVTVDVVAALIPTIIPNITVSDRTLENRESDVYKKYKVPIQLLLDKK